MKTRGLSKRARQVIQLAVLRDSIKSEKGFPLPNLSSIARMERDYAEVSKAIIDDLLKAHDRDRARIYAVLRPSA